MSPRFAETTTVNPEASRAEIEGILRRYGASKFAYAWDEDKAFVAFVAHDRQVRFVVPLPPYEDFATKRVKVNQSAAQTKRLSPEQQQREYDQAVRQRWRALALVVKAKLEAVDAGIAEFSTEFLPYTVLPDGRTVAEHVGPAVEQAVNSGQMPVALLAGITGPLALPAGAS